MFHTGCANTCRATPRGAARACRASPTPGGGRHSALAAGRTHLRLGEDSLHNLVRLSDFSPLPELFAGNGRGNCSLQGSPSVRSMCQARLAHIETRVAVLHGAALPSTSASVQERKPRRPWMLLLLLQLSSLVTIALLSESSLRRAPQFPPSTAPRSQQVLPPCESVSRH